MLDGVPISKSRHQRDWHHGSMVPARQRRVSCRIEREGIVMVYRQPYPEHMQMVAVKHG